MFQLLITKRRPYYDDMMMMDFEQKDHVIESFTTWAALLHRGLELQGKYNCKKMRVWRKDAKDINFLMGEKDMFGIYHTIIPWEGSHVLPDLNSTYVKHTPYKVRVEEV